LRGYPMSGGAAVKGQGQGAGVGRKVSRWTTVKVPKEVRERISSLAKAEDKAEWKIVLDALAFYETQKRSPKVKEELPTWEKVSWYITKLATSVGELRGNPTKENLELLKKTCQQIEERLGVKTELLVRVAEAYVRDPGIDNRVELNAVTKMTIFDILYYKLFSEGA